MQKVQINLQKVQIWKYEEMIDDFQVFTEQANQFLLVVHLTSDMSFNMETV